MCLEQIAFGESNYLIQSIFNQYLAPNLTKSNTHSPEENFSTIAICLLLALFMIGSWN